MKCLDCGTEMHTIRFFRKPGDNVGYLVNECSECNERMFGRYFKKEGE